MGRAAIEHDYPHLDLINLLNAFRMAVAKRVDTGAMAEDDARLQVAELGSRITQEEQRRNAAAVQTRAQAQQAQAMSAAAAGALLQGLGVYNQSMQPPPAPVIIQPQQRAPVTCYPRGRYIDCY